VLISYDEQRKWLAKKLVDELHYLIPKTLDKLGKVTKKPYV